MDKRHTCKIIIFIFVLAGCHKEFYFNVPKDAGVLSKDHIPANIKLDRPGIDKYFISGTVSHHNLVSPIIDEWFYELKRNRPGVKTFIILSPRHYRFNDNKISVTTSSWNYRNKIVPNNKIYSNKIIKLLNIKEDNESFLYEHGIYVMVPFILKYFPGAKIVPVLMDEFDKNNSLSLKLSNVLYKIIKHDKNTFIIISTDFSHRADAVLTKKRDKYSKKIMLSLDKEGINNIYSDNNVGLFVLMSVLEKLNVKNTHILCNTNSFEYSGIKTDDITSYFFTYQY